MAKKQAFYSQVPQTKKHKLVADTNPVGSVTHPGSRALKMVPGHTAKKPPGHTPGFGEPHGWGHPPHAHVGDLRVSLHPNAHQVGQRLPHGVIKPPPATAPKSSGPLGKKLPKLPKLP